MTGLNTAKYLVFVCQWAVLLSCSQQVNQKCSTTASVYNDAPAAALPWAMGFAGGFVNFGDGRCNASFEIAEKNGELVGSLWTARHCSTERWKNTKALTVDIQVDEIGSFIRQIPVDEDFLTRRQLSEELMDEKNIPEAHRKPIRDAFQIQIGAQGQSSDAGCADEDAANGAKANGQHALCANWWDLGVYEVKFSSNLSPTQVSQLKNLAARRAAIRGTSEERAKAAGLNPADLDLWKSEISSVWPRERMMNYAWIISWMDRYCGVNNVQKDWFLDSPRDPVLVSACESKAKILDVARKTMIEEGKNIIELAEADGYFANGVAISSASEPRYENKLKERLASKVADIQNHWQMIRQKGSTFATSVLQINSNVTIDELNSVPRTHYTSLSFDGLEKAGSHTSKLTMFTNGIQYFVKRDSATILFYPGDSGTIISIAGIWPVAALTGVDGEQSSGGASISALPTRNKPAENGQGSGTANKPPEAKTKAADSGC